MDIFVGCAGWNLGPDAEAVFFNNGSHLMRYATRLNGVEINTTFYRSHRASTYDRWTRSTPEDFRFAVKMPKRITHGKRLVNVEEDVDIFLEESSRLGRKLGPYLMQLPPSLEFDKTVVDPVFRRIRKRTDAPVVCEPRHASWFDPPANVLMKRWTMDRVAADPSVVPEAASPGGCRQTIYFRWHGSPRKYYSPYDDRALAELAERMTAAADKALSVWCVFDNTANGAALGNALALTELLKSSASEL